MSNGQISGALERFIHSDIDSIEQLEVLLLLRDDPEKQWTPDKIAEKLYIQPESAEFRLKSLCAKSLCVCNDSDASHYKFACADPGVRQLVDDLRDAYRVRRVTVINLVFSKPLDPLKSFSDAFRIRRDD